MLLLVLDQRTRPELRGVLDEMGVWWAAAGVGLAGTSTTIGELLVPPGTGESALVSNWDQMGTLLASGPSAFVPMALYRYRLKWGDAAWEEFVRSWWWREAPLLGLHRALGGVDLESVASVLHDEALRRADTQADDTPERRAARRTILARFDPDPRHLRYLAFLEAMESDPWAEEPEGLGPWAMAAAGRAWQVRFGIDRRHPAAISAAWRLLRGPVTLYGGASDPLDPASPPSPFVLAHHLYFAAKDVSEALIRGFGEMRGDPWARAIHAAAAAGTEYNGFAHMEAAMQLDIAGRPEEAWNALVSAAFWTRRTARKAVPGVRGAARMLAESHGWERIARELA